MYESFVRLAESGGDCKLFSITRPPGGNFFLSPASNRHPTKSKGANAMNDLHFNPSALLIVGMLIGVVQTLVHF